ncbi:hypothetical protein F4777DRAFT_578430 [Nemania sp. FL0916]|nr:hypothetical protein F4777DRAFT_578430 [Nemania sp. FL0916]
MAETATSTSDQGPVPTSSISQTMVLSSPLPLPRVAIRFCTQCKWMLRAAYFAQELLSTFSTSLGEVALQPTTGGIFVVDIYYADPATAAAATPQVPDPQSNPTIQHRVLWDRKIDGGFPETKELKRRVRDVIEPSRNLGHVDRDYPRPQKPAKDESQRQSNAPPAETAPEPNRQETRPSGPRWPQLNELNSSQPAGQELSPEQDPPPERTANPDAQINLQKPLKDLGPYQRQDNADSNKPVYDPQMPGGGIMPIAPPVALSSRSVIPDASSNAQPGGQEAQEYCEDCQ